MLHRNNVDVAAFYMHQRLDGLQSVLCSFHPCTAELFANIFHSFESKIANTIYSFYSIYLIYSSICLKTYINAVLAAQGLDKILTLTFIMLITRIVVFTMFCQATNSLLLGMK